MSLANIKGMSLTNKICFTTLERLFTMNTTKIKTYGGYDFCSLCDNYTPQIWVEQAKDFGCESCFDSYGVELMEWR